jgi:hypothetical protein
MRRLLGSVFQMKRRLPCLAALVLVLALPACGPSYHVSAARVGALYPSKGVACKVQFQNLNFQEASTKYENLGLVTLSGAASDEFTDPMKKDVEQAACKMGGDAVSLNASGPRFFQFIVWRNR